MDGHPLAEETEYNPNKLLNELTIRLSLRNDAALCRMLGVYPPHISKVRHRTMPLSAALLIRMQEESGLSIRALRSLMGDRRQKYRVGDATSKP
jgi:hypothetical protein